MKGKTKKLAVLVIITVMALFTMAAMVSAGSSGRQAIRGQYAYTGETTCLVAPLGGFNTDFTPKGGVGVIQTTSRMGVVTFERNGTGSAHLSAVLIALPRGTILPNAGTQDLTFDFTYTLADDGKITMVVGPGPFTSESLSGPDAGKIFYVEGVSMDGLITPDGKIIALGKIITLNGGAPDPDVYTITPPVVSGSVTQSICHSSAVLIWQHE